jgi:hypothetical protein
MAIPTVQPISGQNGNISLTLSGINNVQIPTIIQVRNWIIDRIFENADVTTTGAGGWRRRKRIISDWHGRAEWPIDANTMATYEGVTLANGFYIPVGLDYMLPGIGIFQIGAAGTPLEPGATVAMQYQGPLLMSAHQTRNPATNTVEYSITFDGTGPLLGPTPGLIS